MNRGGRKPGARNKHRRITEVQLKKLVRDYEAGKGTEELAVPLSVSASSVARWLREAGVAIRPPGFGKGKDHHAWSGGRHVDDNGYVKIWVPADAPFACMAQKHGNAGGGYAYEHRLVMAKQLGRSLEDYETVHHIDGNQQNNAPENLQLRQGRHSKGKVLRCAACGSHNILHVSLK